MKSNPYKIPPFEVPPPSVVTFRYYWWSWHPCYPYWSKSCWGGTSIEEAWEKANDPRAVDLKYYHNKLIREGDGKFVEVGKLSCRRLSVWRRIARNYRKYGKPSDAKPIKGWEKA